MRDISDNDPPILESAMPLPSKLEPVLQKMYDARTPSNAEILFKFLEEFEEVPLSDCVLTLKDGIVLEKCGDRWTPYRAEVNHLIGLVKNFTLSDWNELRKVIFKRTTFNLSDGR